MLNVSRLMISSPELVCAEEGKSAAVRNDDPEDSVSHCNIHIAARMLPQQASQ